jgi:hypothetical protein
MGVHMGAVFGTYSLIGLIVGVLTVIVLLGVVGAFVVIVVASRAEPDATGRRPLAVYSFGVAFVTTWTALIGSAAVVSSLVQLIGSHPRTYGGSLHPIGDASTRGVVLGGLVLLVSFVGLRTHLGRGIALADADGLASSPAKRCEQSYASAVAFVCVMVMVIALVIAVYTIFQMVAPGVFGSTGRIQELRYFLDASYIALAVFAIRRRHLALAAPQVGAQSVPAAPGEV